MFLQDSATLFKEAKRKLSVMPIGFTREEISGSIRSDGLYRLGRRNLSTFQVIRSAVCLTSIS